MSQLFCQVKRAGIMAPVAVKQFFSATEKRTELLREKVSAVFAGDDYAEGLILQTASLEQDSRKVFRTPCAGVREKGLLPRTSGCVPPVCLYPG